MTDAITSSTSSSAAAASSTSGTSADLLAGQQNLSTGYTTFLTLLTTQLKNQDPTSPLDTNQFTQQLVQMTGVQQQLLSNQLLQQLVNQSGGGGGVSSAVGLIGKKVEATSSTATVSGGQAAWEYNLGSAASNATLTVSDATGQAVWSGTAPDLTAGTHAFTWNGQTSAGKSVGDGGTYTLSITAQDASGAPVTTSTLVAGTVTQANTVNGTVMLQIGANNAPLTSVTSVTGS